MSRLRYLSLQINGRNKDPHRGVLALEYEGYEISLKDFNIFKAVLQSLLDSTYIRLVSPALYDYVGIENERYFVACYYNTEFDYDLQRLLLRIVFREEDDTLVLALKLLLKSKEVEFGKYGENGWKKVFKRSE